MSKCVNFVLLISCLIIMFQEKVDCRRPSQEKGAYAVWAIPSKDAMIRLHRVMNGLRSTFGGPEFDAHLTVIGPLSLTREDALEKFYAACRGLKAYPTQAKDISYGNSFWQSIYLKFNPTSEVVGISNHFDAHFRNNRTTPYLPHMSLLYGDLTDEEKQEAIEEAKRLDHSIDKMSFSIDRLDLYITPDDKTLKSWVKVAEYKLCAHYLV